MGGLILSIKRKGVFWIEKDGQLIKIKVEKCTDDAALLRIIADPSISIWREDAIKKQKGKRNGKNRTVKNCRKTNVPHRGGSVYSKDRSINRTSDTDGNCIDYNWDVEQPL